MTMQLFTPVYTRRGGDKGCAFKRDRKSQVSHKGINLEHTQRKIPTLKRRSQVCKSATHTTRVTLSVLLKPFLAFI